MNVLFDNITQEVDSVIAFWSSRKNGTRFAVAKEARDFAQSVMDACREDRVEELRAVADAGLAAQAELDELGAPLKPRAPRSDKGKTRKPKRSEGPPPGTSFDELSEVLKTATPRKPKDEQKGLGIDGDGSGSALANA